MIIDHAITEKNRKEKQRNVLASPQASVRGYIYVRFPSSLSAFVLPPDSLIYCRRFLQLVH